MTIAALQGWCPWCGAHMGWGGWLMMLFWLLVVVAVVALVWMLARRGGLGAPSSDRAEAVLRERYARGEIDEETFRRMLDELRRERT